MNTCVCCSGKLLCHIRHNSIYWFCLRCREEMPILGIGNEELPQKLQKLTAKTLLPQRIELVTQ
jgi:hypothetical protein